MVASKSSVVFMVLLVVATTSLFDGADGVRFLSFDASLLLGSDAFALERVDNINYALALAALTDLAEHADAVCLQGYWLPYQVMKLQAILTPYLAHSYSATPAASLCSCNGTSGELTPLTTCLTNCASLAANQQLLCGFKCLQLTQPALSTGCSSCITGGLNGLITNTTDFATLLQTCVMNAYSMANDSVCYPYGGYSGNVLFSRSPLKNATTHSLATPGFFNSDAIFATSSFSGVGNVNLVCTQLQPAGPLPTAEATTYGAALNAQQTAALQAMIEGQVTVTGVKQVVVMGNFKQSPNITVSGTTVVQPINEAPYGMWAAYEDPIRDTSQCTYCPANPLISATYLNNTMSSHIFLRGFENNTNVLSVTGQVTLNTTTTILDLTSGSTPSAKTVPYSPNYGVQVDINTVPSSASSLCPSTAAALFRYASALLC